MTSPRGAEAPHDPQHPVGAAVAAVVQAASSPSTPVVPTPLTLDQQRKHVRGLMDDQNGLRELGRSGGLSAEAAEQQRLQSSLPLPEKRALVRHLMDGAVR